MITDNYTQNKGTKNKEIKINTYLTLLTWILFGIVSISCMIYVSMHKTIVIADEGSYQEWEAEKHHETLRTGTPIEITESDDGNIHILIPQGIKAENVAIENHYLEKQLCVYLKNLADDVDFNVEVSGDLSVINEGYYQSDDGELIFRLYMDGIYEYENTMNEGELIISMSNPSDIYDCIFVVDPAFGGPEYGLTYGGVAEKNIVLKIVDFLKRDFESENIKIYYTRVDDESVSDDSRLSLIDDVDAGVYIRIGLSEDSDTSLYGIRSFYNDKYFIPGVGNVWVADLFTRNVTVAVNDRAIGILSAADNSILKSVTIPAADIRVGFLSNESERELLCQDVYLEKIAKGLANAISEVYTNLQNNTDKVDE